jgi:plastocyanin
MSEYYRVRKAMDTLTRRRLLGTVGSCLLAGLAGCRGSADGAEQSLPNRVEVTMTSMPRVEYDPGIVHIATGGTVVWRLESGTHDTVAYHPETKPPLRMPEEATPWASESMASVGESFEWTFEKSGIYDYVDTEAVCTSHASVGTMGRVIVGTPSLEGQPAMAPPQGELPRLIQSNIESYNERTRALLGPETTTDTQ